MKPFRLVWLDDNWDNPETPERYPAPYFKGSKSVIEVCRWIKAGEVRFISFDHDLGRVSPFSGYTVAKYVEKLAYQGKIETIGWAIHSANPVGRDNITRAMQSAERFWKRQS